MLTLMEKKKLDSYFGFAKKSKSLAIGMDLDQKLKMGKVSLLVLLEEGSSRAHESLRKEAGESTEILSYKGDYSVSDIVGKEKLKAVGITNLSLGQGIASLLKKDMEGEDENEGGQI